MKQQYAKSLNRWAAVLMTLLLSAGWNGSRALGDETPAAGGIRTQFGDVLIENLGIGQKYNLRDLAGIPMKVTNSGAHTVNLAMDVVVPTTTFITPRRLEIGYEPIPDESWVTLSQTRFLVPAGESAYADVFITIPNDPALYGRKFQASIYSRTIGKNFLQVGVWSHLEMTIVQSPEAQKEMEKNHERGIVANMDYTLLPDKLVIENFPLGRRVNVKKETKRTMMLANSAEQPVTLSAKAVSIGSTPLTLQTGSIEMDLSWIHLRADSFEVQPSSFEDPGIEIQIPDKPEYKHKKFMGIIKVEPADRKIIGVTYYGKLYVETQ